MLRLLIGLLLFASPVVAAECEQQNAIYLDASGKFRLDFVPSAESKRGLRQHGIQLIELETYQIFSGGLMNSYEPLYQTLILGVQCIEDDLWTFECKKDIGEVDNVIYRLDVPEGAAIKLPSHGDVAAQRLLVSGLGRSLIEHSVQTGGNFLKSYPSDVFSFDRCRN
ncbi:MAG: hypothetical protein N4A65_00320 [Cohaesibacter sp.]|jgi:hypothetical protein|nr:hypothetical protein [Cohaesibacter sp.]